MRLNLREPIKALARGAALAVAFPSVLSFRIRSQVLGADRALEGSSQAWALVPGLAGQYLRRAFLSRAVAHCAPSATVEFGTIFSAAGVRLDENVYVGPRCHLGLVHIERDALLAAGVHVPSGARTHGIDNPSAPIREQPGEKALIRIGAGSWIGSAAIVMADVGRDTVVGAGAVVTHPLPDRSIAAGVPARVIRRRADVVSIAATRAHAQ